jgi:hypothetical protein
MFFAAESGLAGFSVPGLVRPLLPSFLNTFLLAIHWKIAMLELLKNWLLI